MHSEDFRTLAAASTWLFASVLGPAASMSQAGDPESALEQIAEDPDESSTPSNFVPGPTNGVKPYPAGGGPIEDKAWFRIVESGDYEPGTIHVRFKSESTDASRAASHQAAGATDVLWGSRVVPNLYQVAVRAGSEVHAINRYLDDGTVAYAEPLYRVYPTAVPDDTRWSEQWGMKAIYAPDVWDTWQGDVDFKVAVIDTGINLTHPDLAANIWTNPAEAVGDANNDGCPGICGVDDDGDGLIDEDSVLRQPGQPGYTNNLKNDDDENGFVDDTQGWDTCQDDGIPQDGLPGNHGTHVAGILGAIGDNDLGVAGVNWTCKIVAIRAVTGVTDISCPLGGNIVRALEYAYVTRCRLSNNSYGSLILGAGGYSQAHYDMIKKGMTDYDHVFVAGAGNNGRNIDVPGNEFYPAGYDLENIISVANFYEKWNGNEVLWPRSNYGVTSVDLAAPGTRILSTVAGQAYGEKTGTSMAAPHVTGVAALILSSYPYVHWSQLVNRILEGAEPDADFDGMVATGGQLDARRSYAVWVDFALSDVEFHTSPDGITLPARRPENGSYKYPYNTIPEGVSKVPLDGTISMVAGSTSWTGTISKPMFIVSYDGAVTIGR